MSDTLKQQKTPEEAMAEFLAKGGIIQKIDPGVSGRVEGYSAWGAPGKKKSSASPLATPPDEDE